MKDTGLENLYIFLAEKMVKNYKQGSQNILNELKTGITVDQWVVLKYIGENEGASQVDIAKSSAKDAPTTTRIIDQLVRKKLVQRKADATDRRKFKMMMTEKGENLVKKIVPKILKHRHNTIKGIKDTELKTFISTLKKMLNNL
jgi:DNA-binding MarR family transcriptional regulator